MKGSIDIILVVSVKHYLSCYSCGSKGNLLYDSSPHNSNNKAMVLSYATEDSGSLCFSVFESVCLPLSMSLSVCLFVCLSVSIFVSL